MIGAYDVCVCGDKKIDKKTLAASFIWTFLMLSIGIGLLIHGLDLRISCTYRTTATVTEIHSRKSRRSVTLTYYYDLVFEYNGKEYGAKTSSQQRALFSRGDEVQLWIDPDNPHKSYRLGEPLKVNVILVFLGFGALGVYCSKIAFKRYKLQNESDDF